MAAEEVEIIAGIDEAGYGPTLGPLVVSSAVFEVPEGKEDLWAALAPAVSRKAARYRVAVDDSKRIYRAGRGLAILEESVLAFLLALRGSLPKDLKAFIQATGSSGTGYLDEYPWYRRRPLDLPLKGFPGRIQSHARRIRAAMDGAGVRMRNLRIYPVEVRDFNRGVRAKGSKAAVCFERVLRIIRWLWSQAGELPVRVLVDRQGGRSHYGALLGESIRPEHFDTVEENDTISHYRLAAGDRRMEVRFACDEDTRSLPVALASMSAKYTRELHMSLFNRFWQEHAAHLKPTAGYPQDARRFLGEIRKLRGSLRVADRILIRLR